MKKIGFLSFGHWTPSSQSQTRSAADTPLQSIDLAIAAEELGADGAQVETARPGKYSDGGNLYLVVSTGSRKWVLRFTWRGRAKEMGLGSALSVPLADARERATMARRMIVQGLNPIEERKRDRGIPTFGEMADQVRESLSAGFRNEKHKAQWRSTLATYAAPLKDMPVDTVTTDNILAVLKPIWTTKSETASRLRGRIEKILDAAKAKSFRWCGMSCSEPLPTPASRRCIDSPS
jgi:hypothetical protein